MAGQEAGTGASPASKDERDAGALNVCLMSGIIFPPPKTWYFW